MLEVLIAQDHCSPILKQQLLMHQDKIRCDWVDNGKDCLGHLSERHYDVLVLDVFMPQMDGADVLKMIQEKSYDVDGVICTALMINDWIMRLLQNFKIDYLLMKPFNEMTLVEKIMSMKFTNPMHQHRSLIESSASNLLHEIGIPSSIHGYRYLKTAIIDCYNNGDRINQITKTLYPYVAKQHQTTASRVERCIRHAIEVAFNRADSETIYKFFKNTIQYDRAKPTNSEFIAICVDYMRYHTVIS